MHGSYIHLEYGPITHIKVLLSLWRPHHLEVAQAGEPLKAEVSVYLNSECEAICFN